MVERRQVWGTHELPIGYYAKSFLGSPNSIKCLVTEDGYHIFNSASSLLEHLDIEHPVFRYIVDISRGFKKVYGSRSTDELLYFIHSWCTMATQLNDMGIPLDDLLQEVEHSLTEIIQYVDTIKQTVPRFMNMLDETKVFGIVSKNVIVDKFSMNKETELMYGGERNKQVTDDKLTKNTDHSKMDINGLGMKVDDDHDHGDGDDDVSWFFDDTKDQCDKNEHSLSDQVKIEPDKDLVNTANTDTQLVDVKDKLQDVEDDDDDVSWFFDNSVDDAKNSMCNQENNDDQHNQKPVYTTLADNIVVNDKSLNNDNNDVDDDDENDVSWFFDDSDAKSNEVDTLRVSKDIKKNKNAPGQSFDPADDDTIECGDNDDIVPVMSNDSSHEILEELMKLQNDIKSDIEKISSIKHAKSKHQSHKTNEKFYINGDKSASPKEGDDNDEFDSCFDDVAILTNIGLPSNSYSNEIKLIDSLLDRIKQHKMKQASTNVNKDPKNQENGEKEAEQLKTRCSKEIKHVCMNLDNTAQYVSTGKKDKFASNYELENILLRHPANLVKTSKVISEYKDSSGSIGIGEYRRNNGMKKQAMKSSELSTSEIKNLSQDMMKKANDTPHGITVDSDPNRDRVEAKNDDKDETVSRVNRDLSGFKLNDHFEGIYEVGDSRSHNNCDLSKPFNGCDSKLRYKSQSNVSSGDILELKLNDNLEISGYHRPGDVKSMHNDIKQLVRSINPHNDDHVNNVVCNLIDKQCNNGNMRLNIDLIESHFIVGMNSLPYIIDGVVLATSTTETVSLQTVQGKSCRALLINGDIKMSFKHKGYKPTRISNISTYSSVYNTPSDQWIQEIIQVIQKFSINILLVKGTVSSDVYYICQSLDVIILDNIPYKQLSLLSEASQCDMLTYITLASEYNVVDVSSIQPLRSDWFDVNTSTHSKQDIVVKLHDNNPLTVIISECTHVQTELLDRQLWDSLHRVDVLLKYGYYIPGCGLTEELCSKFLETSQKNPIKDKNFTSKDKHLYKQPVQDSMASTFQEFSQLLSNQISGNRKLTNQLLDSKEHLDCYKSKIETWTVALDCVKVIMKLDCQIITGLTENLNDRTL